MKARWEMPLDGGARALGRYRFRRGLRRVLAVAALVALSWAGFEGWREWLRASDPEWRFAEEVLLGRSGSGEGGAVRRWVHPVIVTLVDATDEDAEIVAEVIADLNAALDGTGMSLRLGDPGMAHVRLMFRPHSSFWRIVEGLGGGIELPTDPDDPASGFFQTTTAASEAITGAVAVVDSGLDALERRRTIIHELTHTLGFMGHSDTVPESAVFARGRAYSQAVRLASVDRNILRLLYVGLQPGDGWMSTRLAYWRSRAE